jgi:hypothetical protein
MEGPNGETLMDAALWKWKNASQDELDEWWRIILILQNVDNYKTGERGIKANIHIKT